MNRCTVKPLRSMLLTLSMLGFAACAASLPNYSAVVANPDRPANERELDEARKPSEVLAFYGVKGGDKVADLWAGRGYYTAILSEVVGPTVSSIRRIPVHGMKSINAGRARNSPTCGSPTARSISSPCRGTALWISC